MNSDLLNTIVTMLFVVIAGFAGGFINSALVGFRPRRWVSVSNSKESVYDLGSLGNIIIGGGAAFAFWALGIGNPYPPQVYGAAFLSGLGGARILGDLLRIQVLSADINSTVEEIIDENNVLTLEPRTTELLRLILKHNKNPDIQIEMISRLADLVAKKRNTKK